MKKVNFYNLFFACMIGFALGFIIFSWTNVGTSSGEAAEAIEVDIQPVGQPVEKTPPQGVTEPQKGPVETPKPEYSKLYTTKDAIALAKTLWGEARGVPELRVGDRLISSKCQQAAVAWAILNRVDDGQGDIIGVITARYQFTGYRASNPVEDEFLDLAYDVLERWNREKHGETEVGRVIPSDFFWFRGDGTYNHFRNAYGGKQTWDWSWGDPYFL